MSTFILGASGKSDCANTLEKTSKGEKATDCLEQKKIESTSVNASQADESWNFFLIPTGFYRDFRPEHGADDRMQMYF